MTTFWLTRIVSKIRYTMLDIVILITLFVVSYPHAKSTKIKEPIKQYSYKYCKKSTLYDLLHFILKSEISIKIE